MSHEPNENEVPQVSQKDEPPHKGDMIEVEDDLSLDVQVEGVADVEPPVGEQNELEQRIAELEAKNKETYDRLLRATADIDNLRKRSKREIADAAFKAKSKTLLEVVPVIDNLDRAMEHAAKTSADSPAAQSVVDGVELVLRSFSKALERCGTTPIDALHKSFDPNLHEAVSQVPSDEHSTGTIISVLQTGYNIGERLLRPSMVVVSSGPSASSDSKVDEGEA